MGFSSLIWLDSSVTCSLSKEAIKDLELVQVYKQLIEDSGMNHSIIEKLCLDEQTICYRQAILGDFMNAPKMLAEMMETLIGFKDIKYRNQRQEKKDYNLYELIHLMVTVELSMNATIAIYDILKSYPIKSTGLIELLKKVEANIEETLFLEMKKDLKEIRHILDEVKSVELSINMNTGMRPVEAQVTGFNQVKYRFPKAFRHVTDVLENEETFFEQKFKVYNPIFGVGQLDWDLLEEVEYSLKKHKKILYTFVNKYEKIDIKPYLVLLDEMTFYQASSKLFGIIREVGSPLCIPQMIPMERRELLIEQGYNLKLVIKGQKDGINGINQKKMTAESIICNDFSMNKDGNVFILTGANRGGKTTFTQAIGQIQVLAQLGLYVPAKSAVISPIDGIYTHFPVQENETVDLGKFGKECQMFSEQFHQATSNSLLLLNESFAGTSHLESLRISEEIVRAVHSKGIRMLFNTHLHELPRLCDEINQSEPNDFPLVSIVTGTEGDERSFVISKGDSFGMSYAREIAKKYGVTFEQLLKSREVNHEL